MSVKCYRSCSRSVHYLLTFFFIAAFSVDAFNNNRVLKQQTDNSLHRVDSSSKQNQKNNIMLSSTARKQKLNDDDDDDGNDDGASPTLQTIRAGFIGCGTIASAIATGLATPEHAPHLNKQGLSVASISVTKRSESKSSKLKENFPDVVTVCDSAEEVVKNSDIVFLCVLPQYVDGVLEDLAEKGVWREEDHTLVSLVATSNVDDLIQKSGLPKEKVYKMICLPPIAKRQGCALVQPPASKTHPYLISMLNALSGCVECANDDIMNAMMIPGCMMGPMYGVMANNRNWLVKQGVSPEDASYFVGRSYLSMVQDAERDCRKPDRFDALVEEQTPGGLNEQALGNLDKQKVFGAYDNAMDAVLSRLQGKSDGSLPSDPVQNTQTSFSGTENTISHQTTSTTEKQQLNNDRASSNTQTIRAGFIGCGTIASAIANGLASPDNETYLAQQGLSLSSISVTRRSESKSSKLKEDYPNVVTVYDSAEEVVTNSDVVFLCVLPQLVDSVLEDLTKKGVWRTNEHTLISLVSTSKVDDLIQKSGLPNNKVYKMICLPAIAKREGCALLQPAPKTDCDKHDPTAGAINVKTMLDALGGCVECANDDVMNTMMVTTGMMGPMYGVMRNNRDWLVKQGVPPTDASFFVGRSCLSIVQDAERDCQDPGRFDALIDEQTPGGLNEQSLGNLDKQSVFGAYNNAMDAVLSRLQGKSDGSLPSDP